MCWFTKLTLVKLNCKAVKPSWNARYSWLEGTKTFQKCYLFIISINAYLQTYIIRMHWRTTYDEMFVAVSPKLHKKYFKERILATIRDVVDVHSHIRPANSSNSVRNHQMNGFVCRKKKISRKAKWRKVVRLKTTPWRVLFILIVIHFLPLREINHANVLFNPGTKDPDQASLSKSSTFLIHAVGQLQPGDGSWPS